MQKNISSVLDEPRHPKFDEEVLFYHRMGTAIATFSGLCIIFFVGGSILSVIRHQVSGYTLIAFLLGLDSIAPIICVSASNRLLLKSKKQANQQQFLRNFFGVLSAPLIALLTFFGIMSIYMGIVGSIRELNFIYWMGLIFSLLLGGMFMVYFVQTGKIINKEKYED
ncbi:MAG: hypothetical protein GY810_17715 [Aureispira sp.]|nr:hypothetical protein [Aureispira sp.]